MNPFLAKLLGPWLLAGILSLAACAGNASPAAAPPTSSKAGSPDAGQSDAGAASQVDDLMNEVLHEDVEEEMPGDATEGLAADDAMSPPPPPPPPPKTEKKEDRGTGDAIMMDE